MPLTFDYFEPVNDDASADDEEASGASEYQVLLQQSVTMLAYMDRTTHNSTVTASNAEPKMLLGFSPHDLPILIGAAVGAAGLIIIILLSVIIWHCCKLRVRNDKAYCLDNCSPDETFVKQNNGSIVHSDSVVFLGVKNNQVSTRAIGITTDIFQSSLTRSQSASFRDTKEVTVPVECEKKIQKRRPNSQPVPMCNLFSPLVYSPKRAQSVHSHSFQSPMEDIGNGCTLVLPSIPEVVLRSSEALHDAPPLYASCNALDGPYSYSSLYSTLDSNASMKTRSLPSWGRSRPRPLSTEDDLNELYAKVSFSKKRKNRMRSDSAAAIAANKSRNTYVTLPYAHKDTDSLVDNEAVVVYDERTAL